MSDAEHTLPELRDAGRLMTLEATALMDSPAEEEFDRFTRLASKILQTPVALISLVDQNRQFSKSGFGLPASVANERQLPLSHSFCKHVVATAEPLVVADLREHPLLRDNLAISELGVIAYLGIPLKTSDGYTLGSLCVIDTAPREWTEREREIMQDLADLVMTKIELRLLAKSLHTDYLKLRNLELHRDEMVNMLIHDLRNPLTSFLSGLELTQRTGGLTDKQKKYVDLARNGGEVLLQMVSNILDIHKAETGNLELDLDEVTPTQIVEAACTQLVPLAEKADVLLKFEGAKELTFHADANKLCRVLINLISNAIQHTPTGGEVTVAVQADNANAIRFSVTDTGYGIPPDAYEQIFQKFGQVKTERRNSPSTGLGLPFSRMVVEAHGGSIWVESKFGNGTSFHFTIPAELRRHNRKPSKAASLG